MARVTSMNMLLETSGKDFLAELYGKTIENVQKKTLSSLFKNMDLSGEPTAGSVEAKRFANASVKDYGTARTAGKGDGVTVKPVTVPIDQNKEIVEELQQKDITMYGVDGVLTRRANRHAVDMAQYLDKQFFAVGKTSGTAFTTTETEVVEIAEAAIQQIETTKNDFVDGVERSMINFVCSPKFYGKIRNYVDTLENANVNSGAEEIKVFHGVKIYSTINMPDDVEFMLMIDGAIAQPVRSETYTAEKIQLSNAFAVSMFFYFGTTAVTPDLIIYKATSAVEPPAGG